MTHRERESQQKSKQYRRIFYQYVYIYKYIRGSQLKPPLENIKEKWELELNTIMEDNMWEDFCAGSNNGTKSQLRKE